MELTEEILEKEVRSLLRGMWSLDEQEDGSFEYEFYADYRDEFSDKAVIDICESDDPDQAFDEYMQDAYQWAEIDATAEIKGSVVNGLEKKYSRGCCEEWDEWLNDFLQGTLTFKIPADHYLKQTVKTDIFVDTGDANYDFVLNCRYPAWNGASGDEIDPKASIRWLAETQGYTEPQLRAALDEGDMADPKTFLESLRVELANTPSHIMQLVFLAEMTVGDLIELNKRMKGNAIDGRKIYDAAARPDCGTIHISKRAETGLYNSWDGGGPFEIMLEKDVDLPVKYIHSVLPDGGQGIWSIDATYGMCRSAWRDVVSEVREKEGAT